MFLLKHASLILLFTSVLTVHAQESVKDKARTQAKEAVQLMDKGNYEESIRLLEDAQKLDPENINYPYELGYAYYLKKDFKAAFKYLNGIKNHKDVSDIVYQLLGNTYDHLEKPEKAIETYEEGLKLFPKSGNLHLELGVMQMMKKDYNKGLFYFERGIEVAPKHPSNYFWASKIFLGSSEKVWGLIYGEIFMNLERNSKRTVEISKLLYDSYKENVKFSGDTSRSVSFCSQMTISAEDLKEGKDFKLPFCMIYETLMGLSVAFENQISLNSLNSVRNNFLDNYFQNGRDKDYPNTLFSFQKEMKEAGHFEAYNHWLLMKGDEEAFDKWYAANKPKWERFIKWFTDNKIPVSETNKFFRKQYQ